MLAALLGGLFVVSVGTTLYLIQAQQRTENPLAPPPVSRTIALRDILSTDVITAEETPQPAASEEERLLMEVTATPEEILDLPPLEGLAREFPGVRGPQRIEDGRSITTEGSFVQPRWSPLGLDVAMVREDTRELWIQAGKPGGPATRLTRLPELNSPYYWNPDGVTLRFQQPALGGWVEVLLTGELYPTTPVTNPLLVAGGRIIALPSVPGEPPLLLSGPGDEFSDPQLSPDGAWAVFQGRRSGLYLAGLRSRTLWRLGPGQEPTWLPNSTGIVFVRMVEDMSGPVGGDLWLATVNGRHLTNLTLSPGRLERHPHFAPDGERVAYTLDGAVHVGVYRTYEDNNEATDRVEVLPDPDAQPDGNETDSWTAPERELR
jgi:hypothetical protein